MAHDSRLVFSFCQRLNIVAYFNELPDSMRVQNIIYLFSYPAVIQTDIEAGNSPCEAQPM